MRLGEPLGIGISFFQSCSGAKSTFSCSKGVVPLGPVLFRLALVSFRIAIVAAGTFRFALNATFKRPLLRSKWTTPARLARDIPPVPRTGIQYSLKEIAFRGSRNAYVSWFRNKPA